MNSARAAAGSAGPPAPSFDTARPGPKIDRVFRKSHNVPFERSPRMAGQNTLTFNDGNFETEVVKANVPVLVDFWAQWCGPCLMIAPAIDELATAYVGKAKIGKVDVDQEPALASRLGVQNIPTVLLYVNGKLTERIVGAKHKRDYQAAIDAHLPK
jgi:thioredoxin 1